MKLKGSGNLKINAALFNVNEQQGDKMSTNTTENTILAGYWKDARGILTPESLVKLVDKERDTLVKAIVELAKPL